MKYKYIKVDRFIMQLNMRKFFSLLEKITFIYNLYIFTIFSLY